MNFSIRLRKGFCLILSAILISSIQSCTRNNLTSQQTQEPAVTAPHSFLIFSQIRYNNTPADLSQYGISPSMIHGPGSFLNPIPNDPNTTGNPNLDNKIIDSTKLATLAQNDLSLNPNVPVILDIESWSFSAAELPSTINSFARAIKIYKTSNARSPLGFYGNFPQTKYQWSNIENPTDYQTWQVVNNQLAPIVKLIQFFAPSLYTRDDVTNSDNWRLFAQANLNEAKRYNVKIPVYAYISPQYMKNNLFLPASYWQYQLDQLYNMGYDGVIIWTSNKDSNGNVINFNTAIQQDWWTTTLNFIKDKNIKAQ